MDNFQLLDVIWIILCAGLVMLMQAGFCCLESGLVRSKNSINVAIKNLADFCVSSVLFWAFGFAIMFGSSYHGWFGTTGFFYNQNLTPLLTATFMFQLVFCGTATTIISGAIAERTRFAGYLVIAVIVSGIIYPVMGHWAWGGMLDGELSGWLGKRGFIDFAGSTVVHSTGGWVALAAAIIIGPRIGRFTQRNIPIHGHNLPMATLGAFLLWFGWFGFNGGSELAVTGNIPIIILNTTLSAAIGGFISILLSWKILGRPDVQHVINGCLAGLVAITASCNIVTPSSSLLIGAVAGALCLFTTLVLEKLKIDDAVGAIPVHCFCGVWGTLAVALFGNPEIWGSGLNRGEQLLVQLMGIGTNFIWAFGISYILLWIINRWMPFRISPEDEHIGLNVAEHNAHTETIELLRDMRQHSRSGIFSAHVRVEPHTETGQIASGYNLVVDKFNEEKNKLIEVNKELEISRDHALETDQAKSDFLANMSHELRTPLNAVIGYSELLQDDAKDLGQDSFIPDLKKIQGAGKHLLALINNILDLSKVEAGKMELFLETFPISRLIKEMKDLMVPLNKKNSNTLHAEYSENIGSMHTDMTKLRQILFNLLSNASKFTNEGLITLKVIGEMINGQQWVRYSVTDTGIGMSEKQMEQLFKPFSQADSTTSRTYGGTGLGLAISQRFCQIMGGGDFSQK